MTAKTIKKEQTGDVSGVKKTNAKRQKIDKTAGGSSSSNVKAEPENLRRRAKNSVSTRTIFRAKVGTRRHVVTTE